MISIQQPDFFVSVNSIIIGFLDKELMILTVKENSTDKTHLPTDSVRIDESFEETAKRIIKEQTHLEVSRIRQTGCYSPCQTLENRRNVEVVYSALVNLEQPEINSENLQWIKANESGRHINPESFMVNDALKILQREAASFEAVFSLLPKKFTLTQLQALYEAIYSETLDKRNFRKKIFSLDILEKLNEKDKLHSRKGAFFYTLSEQYLSRISDENYSFPDWASSKRKSNNHIQG